LVLLRLTGSVVANAVGDSCPWQVKNGTARTRDWTSRDSGFLVKLLIIGS
jgi:hypothetical protein